MLSTIPYHGARRPLEPGYMNDAPRRRTEWRDHARIPGGPRRLAGPFSCPCRLQCCSSGYGVRAFCRADRCACPSLSGGGVYRIQPASMHLHTLRRARPQLQVRYCRCWCSWESASDCRREVQKSTLQKRISPRSSLQQLMCLPLLFSCGR